MLGLYLHIPFCSSICSYCNFNRGLFDSALKLRYVEALEREIHEASAAAGSAREPADTIFFGGGTPSLLEPREITRLIGACKESYDIASDAEITLETNPETVTAERMEQFLEGGVNRISFGVQSFEDEELSRLGRVHSAERAREAVRTARAAGCINLSLDLMLWLPGQSFASWLRTVDETIALEPDHVSLYLLELYPNAPLKETMARAAWSQAPDDEAADMYLAGFDRLDAAGFTQYEISNTARPGFASRHNLKYWRSGDWRGFGCGAHSTVRGRRSQNVAGTADYVDRVNRGHSPEVNPVQLTAEERFAEALFTGLRLTEGVDADEITARCDQNPWARYGDALSPFLEAKLMWKRDSQFGLTRHGMLVANEILATFV